MRYDSFGILPPTKKTSVTQGKTLILLCLHDLASANQHKNKITIITNIIVIIITIITKKSSRQCGFVFLVTASSLDFYGRGGTQKE